MTETQELVVHGPSMMEDRFYVEKTSTEYQRWSMPFFGHEEVEAYIEAEKTWYRATIRSWYINDGSGNCPGANSHFFLVIKKEGKTYKLDLYEGLRVRVEAPTDQELLERNKWCEGGDYDDYPYSNDYTHCHELGKEYTTKHGQKVWYCDKHKPAWLQSVTEK